MGDFAQCARGPTYKEIRERDKKGKERRAKRPEGEDSIQ